MWPAVTRSIRQLTGRKLYIAIMIGVPLFCTFFFLSLMSEGLPLKVPTAMVDLDHSSMSRQLRRSLDATELVSIDRDCESFDDAMQLVRSGEIYGFFVIPDNFQRDAVGGRTPTLSYYCNLTYFVPGTLTFKGFKTIAVGTSAGVASARLVSLGMGEEAGTLLQPVVVQTHSPGNPWTNYSYYLSTSFLPAVLALMIFLTTAYSICDEIKRGTSPGWLASAGNNIFAAVFAKLLPQWVIFSVMGLGMQAVMFGYCHFPLNNSIWHMILAMPLLVAACQGFALIIIGALPNLRFSLEILSLIGILSFSVAGFSYPVQDMYGGIGIFAYILPVRYYFLIYIDQALNGIPLYYSRLYYVALLLFPFAGAIMLPRLKRHCLKPVYVP